MSGRSPDGQVPLSSPLLDPHGGKCSFGDSGTKAGKSPEGLSWAGWPSGMAHSLLGSAL